MPYTTRVTCKVQDVEANIRIHKPFSCSCSWTTGYWGSHELFIHLQISAGICTVFTADAVTTGVVNSLTFLTRLPTTLHIRDPPGLVCHGKQPCLTRMSLGVVQSCLTDLVICQFHFIFFQVTFLGCAVNCAHFFLDVGMLSCFKMDSCIFICDAISTAVIS